MNELPEALSIKETLYIGSYERHRQNQIELF